MALVVADTSALVSLGVVADHGSSPLDHLLSSHRVVAPERVVAELRDTASFDDRSGEAAQAVLHRRVELEAIATDLDESFPLDDGENAAVSLANDLDASQFLCDEFNQLALVHASLPNTRLVTAPTFVALLVRRGVLTTAEADELLTEMSDARSWGTNAYVTRARAVIDSESK